MRKVSTQEAGQLTMERVILQSLGKVHDLQPSSLVKLGEIDQALVSYPPVLVGELDGVVTFETLGDVVGVEQRELGGISQTLASQHLDVGPRDGGDGSRSPRSSRDGFNGL